MPKNDRLKLVIGKPQKGSMKVGAKIIHDLSSGIYSDPANSIKELIHNSYDADAIMAIIRARPDFDTFSITDDGKGMNYKDFDSKFSWISRSDKRDESRYSKLFNRPLIGMIGIGFIAISQICDHMEVISTKKGENIKFVAEIDFSKFREMKSKKAPFYKKSSYILTNYEEDEEVQYTIINLSGLREGFKALLEDKDWKDIGKEKYKTYEGLTIEEIVNAIRNEEVEEVSKEIGGYWQLLLELASIVPVPYLKNGPICVDNTAKKIIKDLKKRMDNYNFNVDFDGVLLKKPIILPFQDDILEDLDSYNVIPIDHKVSFPDNKTLKIKGYIYNQKRQILPKELSGITIRIKNVAVGSSDFSGADHTFLGYPWAERMYMNWTYGEIYVDEGLEEAMNIDRATFLKTHAHYRELRNYIHKTLHETVFRESRKRYVRRRKKKRIEEELERKDRIDNSLRNIMGSKYSFEIVEEIHDLPIFTKGKKIIISKNHAFYKLVPKKQRELLEEILISLELSGIEINMDMDELLHSLIEYFKLIRGGAL